MSADALLAIEPLLRFGAFAGAFAAVALWEARLPRRSLRFLRAERWPHNLGLVLLNGVVVRAAAPGAAVAVALASAAHGWGLLNAVALPYAGKFLVAVVLLDLAVYFQHVLFHAVPTLWRLHRVHHADTDFDVTTGLRFHPVEIVLSLAIKCGVVAAIGAPAAAVVAFEVVLNAMAMFNHANARLPERVDRALRLLLVTPDMHRIHHSIRHDEHSTNFGFNLAAWDRLFGTYRACPADGHDAMTTGLPYLRDARERSLVRMLLQPLADGKPRLAGGPLPAPRLDGGMS